MIKFEPNGDRVVIRPLKEDELRGAHFSIIVPGDQDKMAAQQGEIMEAGPDAIYKIGDMVIFNPSAGDVLRVMEGMHYEERRIMHSDTIYAKFIDVQS